MSTHSRELFVALQRLLPHHCLSRMAGWLAGSRSPAVRDLLIRQAVRRFNIDLSEAARENPKDYSSFNDFFTRELKPTARPINADKDTLVFPADGAISQNGTIEADRLLQAKGHSFTLPQLLANNPRDCAHFLHGAFATIYLSPSDYHRVHMPIDGELLAAEYVPGRLFSVNATTTQYVPGLFARNERLICHFQTKVGKMAIIMVGAMLVAGIETVWHGRMNPGHRKQLPLPDERTLLKGQELGRFSFGSTVILLFEPNAIAWESLSPGDTTRMGNLMAHGLVNSPSITSDPGSSANRASGGAGPLG